MTNNKPTILIIHGGLHTSVHFAPLCARLENAGYATRCPTLPSIEAQPPIGLMEDAQCVRDELQQLVNIEEKNVIVIAHSYGGLVMTEGVDAAFSKKAREVDGKKGGVIHLIYIAALIVPVGTTFCSAMGWASVPPVFPINELGQCCPTEMAGMAFYSDLSTEERTKWTAELRPESSSLMTTPTTFAAHAYHRVSYLHTEADITLPFPLQQSMVQKVVEVSGSEIRTVTCTAGHSPFLSQPEVVLEIINETVAEVV